MMYSTQPPTLVSFEGQNFSQSRCSLSSVAESCDASIERIFLLKVLSPETVIGIGVGAGVLVIIAIVIAVVLICFAR